MSRSCRFATMATALLVVVAALSVLPTPASSAATEEKVFGEIEPGKALLYVIRPKGARGGNSVAEDVFADAKLLMRLRGNSYGFVHLDPGVYTIWGSGCYRDVGLVPGEVFYLLCGDLGMATITEDEGQAYLERVKYYNPPDPAVEAKRAKKEAKAEANLLKYRQFWEKRSNFVDLQPLPAPAAPGDTTGLLRVPAHSPVELELMENVSSFMSDLGEDIWFRSRKNAGVDGVIWLPAGTPVRGQVVEVHGARRGGGSGGFEIALSLVQTPGGDEVPLIGQLIDAGRHKLGKAYTAAAAGGLLAAAMVRGREAFELSGEHWKAWTRYEVWVHPVDSAAAKEVDPGVESSRPVEVRVQGSLEFNLEKHQDPADITLVVATEAPVSYLELRAVGDWLVPKPVSALRIESRDGDMAATFDGWSLLRHLRPGPKAVQVKFFGRLADGTEFDALADLTWLESSPE